MNKYEIDRKNLVGGLAMYGLRAESWETNAELKNKLSAARAMDVEIDVVENKYF